MIKRTLRRKDSEILRLLDRDSVIPFFKEGTYTITLPFLEQEVEILADLCRKSAYVVGARSIQIENICLPLDSSEDLVSYIFQYAEKRYILEDSGKIVGKKPPHILLSPEKKTECQCIDCRIPSDGSMQYPGGALILSSQDPALKRYQECFLQSLKIGGITEIVQHVGLGGERGCAAIRSWDLGIQNVNDLMKTLDALRKKFHLPVEFFIDLFLPSGEGVRFPVESMKKIPLDLLHHDVQI